MGEDVTKAASAAAAKAKAATTAKRAMTAVAAVTAMAAKAPSATASPRTAAPRPLVRRASREATSRSACQNCHVPMSLCHCQKSACSICGLSALNCNCKVRPASASPRPASASARCQKCAELDESLSKAQAQHKALERELAARRVRNAGHSAHEAGPAAPLRWRRPRLC